MSSDHGALSCKEEGLNTERPESLLTGRSEASIAKHVEGGPLRLINVSTYELEKYGRSTPQYAILSHTWGAVDDEVDLDAWQQGHREDRFGYAKIFNACQQAQKDGLDYLWVDTCCIDKKNSTELSESINSMYKWYRFAQVCYIHLADVGERL